MPARILPALVATVCVATAMLTPAAAAPGYRLSDPITYENLSVYLVHGPSANARAPMTMEEASAKGLVRMHETRTGSPTLDNLSGKTLFVQFGTLLKGGLQDQVVSSSLFVPPGTTGLALPVFCVEKGRSTGRPGDDAAAFVGTTELLPSRVAKLALLSGSSHSQLSDQLRQIGVWLTIASMKDGLAGQLDGSVASARSATSLPLALEHPGVSFVQLPYVYALHSDRSMGKDVIGAVFAINGHLSSAEIYGSHALFQKMWPHLQRAHATEAALAKDLPTAELPSRTAVLAFLAKAERTLASAASDAYSPFVRLESKEAIYAATQSARHGWSHRTYVAKSGATATPIERAVLTALEQNLADAAFTGSTTRIDQPQIVRWLAEITDSPDTAMRQASAAAIIDAAPAQQARGAGASTAVLAFDEVTARALSEGDAQTQYRAALRSMAAPVDNGSFGPGMAELLIALFALTSVLALGWGASCIRNYRAALHALCSRPAARCAMLVRRLADPPASLAGMLKLLIPGPPMRMRYAPAPVVLSMGTGLHRS